MAFAGDTMARNEIEQRMLMLAVRAKDGNTECLRELWGYVDRLCAWYCRKLCQQLPDRYLLEYGDLYNCGYIALCDAVAHFDPASESKFSTYYLFYLTSAIFRENSLPRGRRGKDGEKYHDPIISKGNTSLDAPLKSADEKPRSLQDTLCAPCEAGEDRSIAGAIDRIYLQQLHEALEALILQLSDEEQYFVRQNYFGGVSRKAIAKELQITPHQIIQVEDRTLRRLREKGKATGLEQFISGRVNYYAGTGLTRFKESGSSVERLAERRMELEDRYKKLLGSNYSEENAHSAQRRRIFMNITEILTQAQQSSDAVTDLLIELAQQNKEVTATAQRMCDLYFADVRLREKSIRDKVAELEKQLAELDAKISGMQAAVVDAAGTGDTDTFAQAQDKLAKIEGRKAAVSTQIGMLKAAYVRGSDDLYQAACDAYSDLAKANSAYEKALDEINLVAKKQAEVWKELEDKSESSTWSANTGHVSYKRGKVRDFEKVREHYNAQPEAPKPDSKESSPGINLEIGSFRTGEYPAKGRFTSTPGGNGPA